MKSVLFIMLARKMPWVKVDGSYIETWNVYDADRIMSQFSGLVGGPELVRVSSMRIKILRK